jgi:RHS repeat-associated protein
LQPNINVPAYLPIIDVSDVDGTVTVAGNYSSLGGSMVSPSGGGEPQFKPSRFRIFAPPGVVRNSSMDDVGTLDPREVSGKSSRYLYKGYRYESPLAGFYDFNSKTVSYRQTGLNFAGMYYTLHRHYDPYLMRFTSPDPLAAPFYNLYHYTGNSPARYFDPDGLRETEYARAMREGYENTEPGIGRVLYSAWVFYDRATNPGRYDRDFGRDFIQNVHRGQESLGAESPAARLLALPLVLAGMATTSHIEQRHIAETGYWDGERVSDFDRQMAMWSVAWDQAMMALTFASFTVGPGGGAAGFMRPPMAVTRRGTSTAFRQSRKGSVINPFGGSKPKGVKAGQAGRFADLDAMAVVGDNLTPHHMPQVALNFTSRADGGTLVLPHAQHVLTRTYAGRGIATARADASLSFREVLAIDIRDVRSIAGSSYNSGIRELIRYYRTHHPKLMAKPRTKN